MISDITVATGNARRGEGRRHTNSLERIASGGRRQAATSGDLASMGIKVIKG